MSEYKLQSDEINEIAVALCKAQATISGARKDSKNPFFKSNYADLGSVTEAIRESFHLNDLSYSQTNIPADNGVTVVTTLMHSSGQWLRGYLYLPAVKLDPQQFGSAMTYARRYGLAAIAGVVQEDDDGNSASKAKPKQHTPKTEVASDANKDAYAAHYKKIQSAKTVEDVIKFTILAESDPTWNEWKENWQDNIAGLAQEMELKLKESEPFTK